MAFISAAKPMYGKCNTNDIENDTPYGEPKAVGKMIGVEVKPQFKSGTLSADDSIAEEKKEFNYADVILNTSTLPIAVASEMLGRKTSSDKMGEDTVDNVSDEPNYGAFGYIYGQVVNKVTTYICCFLPRVLFDIPEEKFDTKGENIVFNTPTINGKAYANKNGDWRIKTPYETMQAAIEGLKSKFASFNTNESGESETIPTEPEEQSDNPEEQSDNPEGTE